MVATVIAAHTGADAASVARSIALAQTGIGILVTQLIALLGGQAAKLIADGWTSRPKREAPQKPARKAEPAGEPKGGPKGGQKAPRFDGNVVRLDPARHPVERWLEQSTVQDNGEIRGGDALKAFKRQAGRAEQTMTAD